MLDHFQDCLKSIVCVTFIEFCEGDSQMQGDGGGGGRGTKSYHLRIVYIRVALMCVHLVLRFSISILKSICFIT